MTIEMFVDNYHLNRKVVLNWIDKGYIPRADVKKDYVPDSARPPYVAARAKNANSIYASIVAGTIKRRHVFPALYKICDDEFNSYINTLVEAKLIKKRESDNVIYYDATLEAKKAKKSKIPAIIRTLMQSAVAGATEVVLSKIGA